MLLYGIMMLKCELNIKKYKSSILVDNIYVMLNVWGNIFE